MDLSWNEILKDWKVLKRKKEDEVSLKANILHRVYDRYECKIR